MTTEHTTTLHVDELFAPPTEAWTRVSPALAKVEQISVVLGWTPFVIASLVPTVIFAPRWGIVLLCGFWLLFLGWRLWAVRRIARSWAYAQREADLYVTHGLFFRELSVVPYGRMQVVEVHAGPLLRRYGLANVRMITASSTSDAMIPGVPAAEAARLRDDLSRLGEAQAAGL